jgi:DNA-3-methyladenine glycosylase II
MNDTYFTLDNFQSLCDGLAAKEPIFKRIIERHGYPPIWSRSLNFASLIHIILEQQVSLASALSAFRKLQEKLGEVTPANLLQLSDEEMKACYFSRQKTIYARHLAENIIEGKLNIEALAQLDNDEIRHQLIKIKGIGHWTIDVVLMFCLQRTSLFPIGDIALINSVRHELQQPDLSKDDILSLAENWAPHKTLAAYMFWHAYLERRKKLSVS